MFEDQQEIQILRQRDKQRKLFQPADENSSQSFTLINNRKDQTMNKLDENINEFDISSRIEDNSVNCSLANYDTKRLSQRIDQLIQKSQPDILVQKTDQGQKNIQKKEDHEEQDHQIKEDNAIIDNEIRKTTVVQNLFHRLPKSSLKLQNGNTKLPNKTIITSCIQEPNLQLLMKIMRKINVYFTKYTYSGRNVNLQDLNVRKIINDISDCYENQSKYDYKNFFFSCEMSIKRFLSKCNLDNLKVLSLQNNYVLAFKIFTTIISYVYLFFLSIILLFNLRYPSQFSQTFVEYYMAVQWIVEIILKLNCSTSEDTKFIDTRQEIFSIYFKKQFFFDIFPIILMNVGFQDTFSFNFYFFKSFIFLKFITTEQDLKAIQKQLVIITRKHFIIQIINLNLNLFFVGHIIACLWYLVGVIDCNYLDNVNSWIVTTNDFTNGDWWKVYISAFYWAFTLMATGSNIAASVAEQYFTSIVMPFTTIIFGYMINTIGIILSEIDQQEEFKRKDINIINRYMDRKGISKDLQTRVNLDLDYFYLKNYKKIQEDEEGVLSKVSEQLYKQLRYEYNMNVFKQIKNLSNNFSFATLTELCNSTEEITFSPNQTIFQENQTSDSCLMYIISGSVQISQQVLKECMSDHFENHPSNLQYYLPQYQDKEQYDSRILGVLHEGQSFGELNFFTGLGRQATIKSSSFTRILKISRDQFMEIIQNNQKDLERYCQIRDRISLYQNYSDLNLTCSICQKSDHLNNLCPNIHFNKKNPFFFAKINYSNSQTRNETFKRNRSRYIKFFSKLNNLVVQAQEAQILLLAQTDEEQMNENEEYFDLQSQQSSDILVSQKSIQLAKQSLSALKMGDNEIEFEKTKNSFLAIFDQNKQDEYHKRSSSQQFKDEALADKKNESSLEQKKRNTKQSFVENLLQDEASRRVSHQQKEESPQKGETSIQDLQKKSRIWHQINNVSQERRMTYKQEYISNNCETVFIPQTLMMSKQKQDGPYMHYNKTDEIIQDIILWNLDKMKHFNYYFPSGNFKIIMNRFQAQRKRQVSQKNLTKFSKKKYQKKTLIL